MPLQVVQAKATMPKPSFSSSAVRPASSRYSATVFDPGASDDFTHGLRVSPARLALRASRPAAMTLRGLEVLVQLVIAAMITAPSGISPGSCVQAEAMPRAARSLTGRRRCGLDGPAMVRTTVDRSKRSVRGYCAPFSVSDHRPGGAGIGLHQLELRVVAAGQPQIFDASAGRSRTSPPSPRIPAPCWKSSRGRPASGWRRPRHGTPASRRRPAPCAGIRSASARVGRVMPGWRRP